MTKGQKKKQDILAVARPFLLNEGHPSFSLRDVAKQAGISLGNLQYYFPAKNDLLVYIVQSEIDENLELIRSVDWSSGPPEQTLRTLIETILARLGGEAGQLYLLTAFLALHNDRFKKLQRDGFNGLIAASVEAARAIAPNLSQKDLKMAALIAVSLVDGAVVQIHARPEEFEGTERSEFAGALTNALLRYLQVTV